MFTNSSLLMTFSSIGFHSSTHPWKVLEDALGDWIICFWRFLTSSISQNSRNPHVYAQASEGFSLRITNERSNGETGKGK